MQRLGVALTAFSLLVPAVGAFAQYDTESAKMLRRVKPAVVFIRNTQIARAVIQTEQGDKTYTKEVQTGAGSGFIINPNGYVVTNGHVVEKYHKTDIKDLEDAYFKEVIEEHFLPNRMRDLERKKQEDCVNLALSHVLIHQKQDQQALLKRAATECKKPLSKDEKHHALQTLLQELGHNRANVKAAKQLSVILSNQEKYIAEVKNYSPPIHAMAGKFSATENAGKEHETGKDVAILKIEKRYLPTVQIGDADTLQLGEPIYAIGYPGVVFQHDYLSPETRYDATVTEGIVSGQKVSTREASVIQTTAPLTRGNSGGPALNTRGEVIGIPTFISMARTATGQDTQDIQGFNFLVRINTAMEFVRASGVNVHEESLFNTLWFEALELYSARKLRQALVKFDEVLRILPNQPDARHLQITAQAMVQPEPPIFLITLAASLVTLGVGAALYVPHRRKQATVRPLQTVMPPPPAPSANASSLGTLTGHLGSCAGKSFPIGRDGVKIGRDPAHNQIVLYDAEASREHAWVGEENGHIVLKDLHSLNGTYLNTVEGHSIRSAALQDGDTVIIGKGNGASFVYTRSSGSS